MNIAETKRSRMQMIGVLILALAANLACGLPGQTQSKPTAEPTVAKAPVDVVETAEEINSQPVSAAPLPAPFYLSDLGYFDFDNGSGIAGLAIVDGQPEPAAPDILFYNDRIVPQEGASLVVRDGPAPGYQDCNRAVLSYADLPTEKLHIGSQVCFQTGEEQTGFITVLDLFLDSYGDLVMGFDYTLWDTDGAELPAFHALYTITGITYPRGPSGMDLDFYRNHQVPDLTYHYADIDVLEVQPAGSAQVAIFGPEIPSYEDCASLEMSDEPVALGMEIIPGLSPMKEQQFLCFRTNEGRLGRIYQRMVYFDSSMAPLPYGDIISSLDFYEASTITPGGEETADYMVDYTADTWTLEGEPPFSEVPQRKDGDGFSGRVLLPYKDGFDFDTGSTMMDFRALPDVEYLGDDVSRRAALSPFTDDILLAAMGDSEPGYQDCVEADLLNKLVIMEEGQHYCVKTSAGRYATFLVNDFYFDIDVALDNSLVMFADITYKSWALDGQHYLVHAPALALDDGGDWLYPGGYDLDMIFGSGMLELEMTSETDEQMILTPVQGFSLAYWGVQRPTQADCAGDELGMKPVTVNIDPLQPTNIQGYNKMKAPTFYCYQTDEGRRGVLQVSGTYYQLESDTMYLIAAAETWFDSFETFAQVSAMRDKEMALIAGGIPETGEAPEMPSVEAAGSSVSGEARMGNVTAMDFFNGAVLYDDAVALGDILVEFSPESQEGCFISMGSTGSILGEIPGDLDKIVLTEEEALIGGCMPVVVNTVYSVSRIQPPEGVVLFRVIAFDADGVTLEYIIK